MNGENDVVVDPLIMLEDESSNDEDPFMDGIKLIEGEDEPLAMGENKFGPPLKLLLIELIFLTFPELLEQFLLSPFEPETQSFGEWSRIESRFGL